MSGIAATSSALKSETLPSQDRWLDLAKKIRERCQGWLIPNLRTLSYRLRFVDSSLAGEVRVFYRIPDALRLEILFGDEKKRYVGIFRKGGYWLQEEGKAFRKIEGMSIKPWAFLRAAEVRFGLDEILEAPEKVKVEAIVENEDEEWIQVTLTKHEGFRCYMCLGLQHSIRSFATPLKGTRLTLWLDRKTLQPLTEVLWHEEGEPKTIKNLSVISYKDFRGSAAPHLVDMMTVSEGREWRLRLEFEWVNKKAWVFKKGEGWGEPFLAPKLLRSRAEVTDVSVDEPLPDSLFEPR